MNKEEKITDVAVTWKFSNQVRYLKSLHLIGYITQSLLTRKIEAMKKNQEAHEKFAMNKGKNYEETKNKFFEEMRDRKEKLQNELRCLQSPNLEQQSLKLKITKTKFYS